VPIALAVILALDQRIEWQLPLLLMVTVVAVLRVPGTHWQASKAAAAMVVVIVYLVANSLVGLTDETGLATNWWAAALRVGIFYMLLIALATAMSGPRFDGESVYRTLEWLLLLKVAIAVFEVYYLLQTGEPRERPLFNIILSSDSLLGFRLTSSYDALFAMLALSRRHALRRLLLLAAVLTLTETRALLLLSVFFLGWRLYRERSPWALAVGLAVPVAGMVLAVSALSQSSDTAPRLTQLEGSSLSDKQEQIEAVGKLIVSPYLLTGRGLGVAIPNIVRDEARPYSYEAQTLVLLWQGGFLFYALHLSILWAYGKQNRLVAIFIIVGLGILNPALFALASAFLLVAIGKISTNPLQTSPDASHRHPALHA
jgi:hypothetical protein